MIFLALVLISTLIFVYGNQPVYFYDPKPTNLSKNDPKLTDKLSAIVVKGRAPKNNYDRQQFGDGWLNKAGCDTRNIILNRDLRQVKVDDHCHVLSGFLSDPYTGRDIQFERGPDTSGLVQIDHVVALSDAWQKGAQQWSFAKRQRFANDPLNLLAVDGQANQNKGASDAATWLPPNKSFRCSYVARQVAVKSNYGLWMTPAEKQAIERILQKCPDQTLPVAKD